MLVRYIKKAMVFASLLTLSACASFPNEEVAKVSDFPNVSQYQTKPKVYIDLKFFSGNPANGTAVEVPAAKERVQPMLEKVFKEKALFSEFTFDEFKQEEMSYKLELHFYNHGEAGAAAVMGFLTGFTFGVIPSAATDQYTLKSSLNDDSGTLSQQVSKDSMTTWIGIWFIPMMANSPQKALEETLTNQVKAAIKEMIDSGKLKYALFQGNQIRLASL